MYDGHTQNNLFKGEISPYSQGENVPGAQSVSSNLFFEVNY